MIPELIKVRQELECPELGDPVSALEKKLTAFSGKVKPGKKVGIAIGSRGIFKGAELVRTIVDWVKGQGCKPFIIPAMGSHGASTSAGQKKVLAELGLSESALGCPVRSEIEAVQIGEIRGARIFTDKFALSADHLILLNRIKPHTSFHGKYESGLVKMLAIGLAKRQGAEEMHRSGPGPLADLIPRAAAYLLQKLPVLLGVALLESYQDKIADLEVMAGKEILGREPELLKRAWKLLPRLPFAELEVLVVDELGKNISGTGMDTNVIGRLDLRGMPEPIEPRIKRIVVLDLSAKTAGSAYGIGLADITTKRVMAKLDWNAMRENALASTFVERVRIPAWFDSDRAALEAALQTCWRADPAQVRLCRIRNTLQLGEFWITRNLVAQARTRLKLLSKPRLLRFDRRGNLKS